MSQPLFPSVEDILLILRGELPDGVYAEDLADDPDPAKRSNSSAELRAIAQLMANLYQNLQDTSSDKAISTVTPAGLSFWEFDLFSTAQDSSQPFSTRKQNLLAKVRASGGISLPAITDIVSAILTPQGIAFDLVTYCGMSSDPYGGAWILDDTPLDAGTYLGLMDPLLGAGRDLGITPLDCDLNYAAAGLTAQQLADIQETAYTYEVLIYGNASADTLALLEKQLTALEPARSTHVITNNAVPPQDPGSIPTNVWPILYGQ